MSESLSPAPDDTEVGSYFVANYPPFSVWSSEAVERDAWPALRSAPGPNVPLGLYLHIPFCRKRCHFCYFRVYTDKNAQDVSRYLDVLAREWELYAALPAIAGRELNFVYFGGGTPSFLSTQQLEGLVNRLSAVSSWKSAEEITFECEPGTLTEAKLAVIRRLGVTRLSLGVENFDDHVLEINGRAHRSAEIGRAYQFARSLAFPQINIDLIAGMLGETEENWHECLKKTIALEPDSVTIYQMELPYNTTISRDILKKTGRFDDPVAPWSTKRRWVQEAFETLEGAGYHVGSAYTAVKHPGKTKFVYRDRLWQGADMVGLGVASFGHVNGVHVQNLDEWDTYSDALERGHLPLNRAYRPTDEERMIRELVLQLKMGSIQPAYFRAKYGVDIVQRFRDQLASLAAEGYLAQTGETIVSLTRRGLMRVDTLLPRFFLPQHAGIRYHVIPVMAKSIRRVRGPFAVVSVARASHATTSRSRSRVSQNSDLYLDVVYERLGVALPEFEHVEPDDIPLPYRQLLVHQTDMTGTLEAYVGGRVLLRTLSTFTRGAWYFRRVLLVRADTGRPVEMGAIRIKLDAFPRRIATEILRNELPLGRILRDGNVHFESRARAFLAMTPNAEMMGVFWMRGPQTLYGRRTEILHARGKIGDIVEVLPIL